MASEKLAPLYEILNTPLVTNESDSLSDIVQSVQTHSDSHSDIDDHYRYTDTVTGTNTNNDTQICKLNN